MLIKSFLIKTLIGTTFQQYRGEIGVLYNKLSILKCQANCFAYELNRKMWNEPSLKHLIQQHVLAFLELLIW